MEATVRLARERGENMVRDVRVGDEQYGFRIQAYPGVGQSQRSLKVNEVARVNLTTAFGGLTKSADVYISQVTEMQ